MSAKYFNFSEMLCRCARPDCDAPREMEPIFFDMLDELRHQLRRPVIVTSALRCKAWNLAQGGVPRSGHLDGTEADLACPTSRERYEMVRAAFQIGFPRIGIYPKHVHVGTAPHLPQDVCWRA